MTIPKLVTSLLLVLICLISIGSYFYFIEEPQVNPNAKTTIKIDNSEINLGTIKQGIPKETSFTFTNTGSVPLVIYDVETSCGCTGAKWPKKPIAAGEEEKITVTYDAKETRRSIKTITIYGNLQGGSKMLLIKGDVE